MNESVQTPAARTVLALIAQLALGLAMASLLVMTAAQGWQVFARYILNNSPGWTEPVALLAMNTAMMCGAAVAVRNGRHFSFSLLLLAAGPRLQRVLQGAIAVLVAAVGLALAWGGARLLADDWSVTMAGAPLPEGLRYLPLCVGGLLIALFSLERLLAPPPAQAAGEE